MTKHIPITSRAAQQIKDAATTLGIPVSYADDLTGNAITVELGAGYGVQLFQRGARIAVYVYANGRSTRSTVAHALQAIAAN
jgi:hypothetical protein